VQYHFLLYIRYCLLLGMLYTLQTFHCFIRRSLKTSMLTNAAVIECALKRDRNVSHNLHRGP